MAFYFDTMHNIDLSRLGYDSETNEVGKIKDYNSLCNWAESQDYLNTHHESDGYVRITRTDKKGIIIHQQMVQFPLESFPDSVLLGFNSNRSLLGAKDFYTIPQVGEVEIPEQSQEVEVEQEIEEPTKNVQEIEEVIGQSIVEKTAATKILESMMTQKSIVNQNQDNKEVSVSSKLLNESERHERVTNLAAGLETDDFSSEVTEEDVPDVLLEKTNQELTQKFADTVLPSEIAEESKAEVVKPVSSSTHLELPEEVEMEESVASFKVHLDSIVKSHKKEIKRAAASANDLISSFVALGSGLMDGAITYDQLGREMADKGQEIQSIGQHIANQEKKIAKIASLNKEIDKVLQSEE